MALKTSFFADTVNVRLKAKITIYFNTQKLLTYSIHYILIREHS